MTQRRIAIQRGLAILLPFVLSCSEKPTEPGSESLKDHEPNPHVDHPVETTDQNYLSDLWDASNHSDWDVISGDVNVATGGTVSGNPATWPYGYQFSVEIPSGAIVRCDSAVQHEKKPNETVEIQIHVPQLDPEWQAGDGHPAVYKLEPDSLQFSQPVTVTLCYPPWFEASNSYLKFCFFMISEDPDIFDYSDLDTIYPGSANPRKDIEFETMHFSRWGLEDGGGGGGPLPPVDPGNGVSGGGKGDRRNTYSAEPNVR